MKKVLTFLVIVSMIAFGSAVMARGGKGKGNRKRNGSCRYSQQAAKSGVYQKQKRKNVQVKATKGKRLKDFSSNGKKKGKGMKGKGNGKRLKDGSGQQKKNQYKGSKGKKNGGTTTPTDSTTTS